MDYDKMLKYVKEKLEEHNAIKSKKPLHHFRSRYTHTERVYKWCKRIIVDKPNCNEEILYTAAIFHDIGYCLGQDGHAHNSVGFFVEYAKENNFDSEFIDKVSYIIYNHSDKKLLNDPNSSDELVLLLEADLLDEEGALGVVWDIMAEGNRDTSTYYTALNEVWNHSAHIFNQDYMVTPTAKEYWLRKQQFVRSFILELENDLFGGQ